MSSMSYKKQRNATSTVLPVLALAAISMLVVGVAQSVSAEVRLFANLNPPNGGIADGKAEFRSDGTFRKLKVQIEDVRPNTKYTVIIAGKWIGTITTNSLGRGELERNTQDGQSVQVVRVGDAVKVLRGTTLVLSGQFR